jgi:hypothetical protein
VSYSLTILEPKGWYAIPHGMTCATLDITVTDDKGRPLDFEAEPLVPGTTVLSVSKARVKCAIVTFEEVK